MLRAEHRAKLLRMEPLPDLPAKRTKCEFCRVLDAQPFPERHMPPLLPHTGSRRGRKPTLYGTWLHENNGPEFDRLYEIWRREGR